MRTRIALLTAALTLLSASAALAAPTATGTLSAENPKFNWESSGSGAPDPTHPPNPVI